MASYNKPVNDLDNDLSSSDEDNFVDYPQLTKTSGRKERKSKWLSRNAIMARENRLKKKRYVSNLENQNKNLQMDNNNFSKIVDDQSQIISQLKKEVQYLKSVIANSEDISKLMNNINKSTGMSVTTSLDKTLSLNNYVSKYELPIARETAYPSQSMSYPDCLTPENDELCSSNLLFENISSSDLLDQGLLGDPIFTYQENNFRSPLEEHSYTTIKEDDVGVCLHVSNHKVSLEFCHTCSTNALRGRNNEN